MSTVLFLSCRKDPAAPVGTVGPTPLMLDLPQWVLDSIGPMPMPVDNPLTVEGVALGRRLFHEKMLSDDGTMSCASCHLQEHGFSDPDAFSTGTDGSVGDRNAMAVINLGWSENLFWDGRRHSLEGQAHDPVTNPIEMRNTWPTVVDRLQNDPLYPDLFQAAFGTSAVDSDLVVMAIAQFERTMVSFDSRFDRFYYGGDSSALDQMELDGMALFERHCTQCHDLGLFTDDDLRNNGLPFPVTDSGLAAVTGLSTDLYKFKVPTLRNISMTAPYMHDSRFPTLFDVVTFYGGHVDANSPNVDTTNLTGLLHLPNGNFTWEEKDRLIAFLNTLTDSTFLTDARFTAP
ncbi:MAG: cytochrome-c peroxidase [Flavobacteriales bacterium]|nr:cytochrome-c peroxidase [Flavobacteriales bacterium]MCB9168486.1 cytochrome-c peroxidase [Flavobacteriales bacterium]MCB9182261.1 cytochrome-c peroxidase [Flavobacteriales bacterium]